ncbi:DUF1810 domain-containing protein [Novosphingobium panipatense]
MGTSQAFGTVPDLERFVPAQDEIFDEVRVELSAGHKRTHWMWFVFPQIAGLGSSPMARHYAIANLNEAQDYLAHPILGRRLHEVTHLMLAWRGRRSADEILGSIDAMKFCSSMTLFEYASPDGQAAAPFADALETFFGGSGMGAPCICSRSNPRVMLEAHRRELDCRSWRSARWSDDARP